MSSLPDGSVKQIPLMCVAFHLSNQFWDVHFSRRIAAYLEEITGQGGAQVHRGPS